MINMERVKAECKEWQPKTGQARYYVNGWKQISGIELAHYNTGNLSSVNIDGEYKPISNHAWNKYCTGTKVWIGADDCKVHIDYCNHDYIHSHVMERVCAHYRDMMDVELMATGVRGGVEDAC